jgi:NADPH-dependent 2,4-dienoyl-CoA reductase/sulfur reductase-like enzyme
MSDVTYVVIGAGQAGARAVEALRGEGVDGQVVVIGEELELPYARPELSKGYLAGTRTREDLSELADGWYARHDVELLLGSRAVGLDPGSRTVRLGDGARIGYDRLLLATGSRPEPLDVPGGQLAGVHHLRSTGDADAIRIAIAASSPVVVVGAGWRGLEVASVAAAAGVDVTLVEAGGTPLSGLMGEAMGARFADLHRRHGVMLHQHTRVARVTGEDRVESVELEDGTTIPTATVIVCAGERPCTELPESAGLAGSDGLPVDGGLRTANPRIWAAGDLALAENSWFGGPLREPYSMSAAEQGAHAGRSMAGRSETWSSTPRLGSAQYEHTIRWAGVCDPRRDRLVVRDSEDGSWAAFWLQDGRVAAALQVNVEFGARAVEDLVVDRAEVDAEQLADHTVPYPATRVA